MTSPDPSTIDMLSAHPVDIAASLDDLPAEHAAALVAELPLERRAEVFARLSSRAQVEIAELFDPAGLGAIVAAMDPDDRADVFNRLTVERQHGLLATLDPAQRDELRRLAAHDEGTAGALMTTQFAVLEADQTMQQAIEFLRNASPKRGTISASYILDADGRPIGWIPIHTLVLADDNALVGDMMDDDPVSVAVDADQEEAVRLIARYDLSTLPVVDESGGLVGIITHDDATDAQRQEATEDFQRVSTVRPFADSIRDASARVLYTKRIPWLALLVFGNLFSGAGIAVFEDTILTYVSLVFFLPLLIDSSGNAGSQAATLMVRAMATGDVLAKHWRDMLGRELLISAMLGATMVIVVFPVGLVRGGPDVALVVGISMFFLVILGSLVGMSLPFALSRFKLDPATASGPLVTTISDGVGVIVYFGIAQMILG